MLPNETRSRHTGVRKNEKETVRSMNLNRVGAERRLFDRALDRCQRDCGLRHQRRGNSDGWSSCRHLQFRAMPAVGRFRWRKGLSYRLRSNRAAAGIDRIAGSGCR